ncbi:MAG: ZIP family metal transporter [Candidatus Levybacteria bacterium]|nr:ZIP family metal transporter [Candidatus Levybacteria bacterium]
MSTLTYILLFTFIGSVGALIGGMALLANKRFALRISHFLASFAAGTLLGTAFFDLLPEASEAAEKTHTDVFLWTLIGLIFFFFIERSIHWFHHHEEDDDLKHAEEKKSALPLIIIGDTVHNFIDGIVIAATFMVNVPLGVVTTLAVFAHEVPQEIGDFGLMLHKGMRRKNIILVNVISAAVSFAGAIMTYVVGNIFQNYIAIFLSLTAGFFIYIASSDILPEIHKENRKRHAILESFLLVLGIFVIWYGISLLEPR